MDDPENLHQVPVLVTTSGHSHRASLIFSLLTSSSLLGKLPPDRSWGSRQMKLPPAGPSSMSGPGCQGPSYPQLASAACMGMAVSAYLQAAGHSVSSRLLNRTGASLSSLGLVTPRFPVPACLFLVPWVLLVGSWSCPLTPFSRLQPGPLEGMAPS